MAEVVKLTAVELKVLKATSRLGDQMGIDYANDDNIAVLTELPIDVTTAALKRLIELGLIEKPETIQ